VIHGHDVPVYAELGGGFAARWGAGPDMVALQYHDPDVTLEAFVAFANATKAPGASGPTAAPSTRPAP
jgi:hypothetical protein